MCRFVSSIKASPMEGKHVNRMRFRLAAAVLAVATVAAWSVHGADTPAPAAVAAVAAAPAGAEARTIGTGVDSYAPIVDKVAPTVVTIRSERRVSTAQQYPFGQDPFFQRFFGDRAPQEMPQQRRQGGLGSGVIVSADGYVLTNHHVVDGAEEIAVELTDGRSFNGKVVGSDPPSDLAVVKINGSNFPVAPIGNSDTVRVGDVVLAVGNPMGVGQTVTMGIVSAKGRATGLGDGSFEDFLQTDAPINHGNSGGALVNTRGELVGINSQILSPSGGNIGIGFAIPANMAQQVFRSLITDGRVHRGMLGVTVQSMTPDLARSLKLQSNGGALVSSVQANGPADQAGLKRGDVVTAINGVKVADSNALRNHVASLKPGTKATLTIARDGREQALSATLAELPSGAAPAEPTGDAENRSGAGLAVEPLTPQTARQLGIDAGDGLLVTNVDPAGPAADAGFRRGDVIQEVDGNKVESAAALRRQLASAGDRPALVLVRRGEASLFFTLSPNRS
jgi:serine protease Do